MKKGVVVSLLAISLVGMIFAQGQKKKLTADHSTTTVSQEISDAAKGAAVSPDQCDQELWNHVYHKARLHVTMPARGTKVSCQFIRSGHRGGPRLDGDSSGFADETVQ